MTRERLIAGLGVAAVIAGIIAGLFVSGSPQTQRELRLDERRVADLRNLSGALSRYYRDTRRLPENIERLVDGRTLSLMPRDPETDEPYAYELVGAREFRLCASFLRASRSETDEFWRHADGRQCFGFDFSSIRLD